MTVRRKDLPKKTTIHPKQMVGVLEVTDHRATKNAQDLPQFIAMFTWEHDDQA